MGNPREHTIADLARRIIGLTESGSQLLFSALPADDPKQRQPDIRLARDLLGWQPAIDIDDGLGKTIEYFRSVDLEHAR